MALNPLKTSPFVYSGQDLWEMPVATKSLYLLWVQVKAGSFDEPIVEECSCYDVVAGVVQAGPLVQGVLHGVALWKEKKKWNKKCYLCRALKLFLTEGATH